LSVPEINLFWTSLIFNVTLVVFTTPMKRGLTIIKKHSQLIGGKKKTKQQLLLKKRRDKTQKLREIL
jgi:hypothetical protein